MEFIRRLGSKLKIIGELVRFLWERKLWWMIPIVLFIALLGFVLVMTQGSAIAPFIYTLF